MANKLTAGTEHRISTTTGAVARSKRQRDSRRFRHKLARPSKASADTTTKGWSSSFASWYTGIMHAPESDFTKAPAPLLGDAPHDCRTDQPCKPDRQPLPKMDESVVARVID